MKKYIFILIYLCISLPGYTQHSRKVSYAYNGIYALKYVQYGNGTTVEYTYDKNGNLLTEKILSNAQVDSLAIVAVSVPSENVILNFAEGSQIPLMYALCNPNNVGMSNVKVAFSIGTTVLSVTDNIATIGSKTTLHRQVKIPASSFPLGLQTVKVQVSYQVNGKQIIIENKQTQVRTIEFARIYEDVYPTHRFYEEVMSETYFGTVRGRVYLTEFDPDSLATRFEFAIMLVRAAQLPLDITYADNDYFSDVTPTHPYFPYINTLRKLGIITSANPKFNGDAPVTKEQAALMLIKTFVKPADFVTDGSMPFTDVTVTDTENFPYFISIAKKKRWMLGFPNGSFSPSANLTRGFATKIVHKARTNATATLNDWDEYPLVKGVLPLDFVPYPNFCKSKIAPEETVTFILGETNILSSGRTESFDADLNTYMIAEGGGTVERVDQTHFSYKAPKGSEGIKLIFVITNGKSVVRRVIGFSIQTPKDSTSIGGGSSGGDTTKVNLAVIDVSKDFGGDIYKAIDEAKARIASGKTKAVDIFVSKSQKLDEPLKLSSGIRLINKLCNPSLVILEATFSNKDVIEITGNNQEVAVIGFTIMAGKDNKGEYKTSAINVGGNSGSVTVQNNILIGQEGIRCNGNTSVLIRNNNIPKGVTTGILLQGSNEVIIRNNIIVTQTSTQGNRTVKNLGIDVKGNKVPTVQYNNIFGEGDNTFSQTATNMSIDPKLDAKYLSSVSTFVNTGFPDYKDDDGSRSDIGAGQSRCITEKESPQVVQITVTPPIVEKEIDPVKNLQVKMDTVGGKVNITITWEHPLAEIKEFILQMGVSSIFIKDKKEFSFKTDFEQAFTISVIAQNANGKKSKPTKITFRTPTNPIPLKQKENMGGSGSTGGGSTGGVGGNTGGSGGSTTDSTSVVLKIEVLKFEVDSINDGVFKSYAIVKLNKNLKTKIRLVLKSAGEDVIVKEYSEMELKQGENSIEFSNTQLSKLEGKYTASLQYFDKTEWREIAQKPVEFLKTITAIGGIIEHGMGIRLFPNPNDGKFNLEFSSSHIFQKIEIYNIWGQKIFEKAVSNETLVGMDLQLSQGMYMIRFYNNTMPIIVQKLVIQ